MRRLPPEDPPSKIRLLDYPLYQIRSCFLVGEEYGLWRFHVKGIFDSNFQSQRQSNHVVIQSG
jgi:hypothetical protein